MADLVLPDINVDPTAGQSTFTGEANFPNHITVDGFTIDLSGGATSNQVIQYNGTSFVSIIPTVSIGEGVTNSLAKSILFADGSGNLGQDNANFNWDSTNHRHGIGGIATTYPLEIYGDGYSTSRFIINGSTVAVSPIGMGAFRFNVNTNHLEVSENGGAYVQINTSGSGGSFITYVGAATAVSGQSFTNMNLINSWVLFGTGGIVPSTYYTPSYYKDVTGRVWLRGVAKNGTGIGNHTTPITFMPVGFRPLHSIVQLTDNNSASNELQIDPDGAIWLISGVNNYVSFDNISYMAEQ